MSRKPPAEQAVTLCDADIRSERVVTRRSLLGVLGVGVAAGAILGTTGSAVADSDAAKKPAKKKAAAKKPAGKKAAPKKSKEETDSD